MAEIKEKIEELVNSHIGDYDLFLVEVVASGSDKSVRKVTILVDSDEGVNIDECARLSRNLSADLEELDIIDSKYTLDVSSPGLDQPLKLTRQYKKNVGRRVKVITNEGEEIKGLLKEADGDSILVEEEPTKKKPKRTEFRLTFEQIKHTTVLISFK